MLFTLPALAALATLPVRLQDAPSPSPDQVGVVAKFLAKPGKEKALREKLLAMIAPTRSESGCISYDLHVDQANPAQFFFIENWKDEDALDAHMKTPHFVKYITNGTPELLAGNDSIAKSRILSPFVPRTQSDPRLRAAPSLTLIAQFVVRPEKWDDTLRPLMAMIEPTRAEKGNISYDLFQSRADGNTLYFAENWASKPALKAHMMTPHFVRHIDKETDPNLVLPWTLITLKRISPPGVGKGAM